MKAQFSHKIRKEVGGKLIAQTITGTVYRDAFGRTRKDMSIEIAAGVSLSLAYVYDPIAKIAFTLNHTNGTATAEVFHDMGEVPPSFDLPTSILQGAPAAETEDLGQQEIGGIECYGYLVRYSNDVRVEVWVSLGIASVVLEKRTTDHDESARLLFNISLNEPDENLFVVPDSYVIC